jgi:hypothetical protein
MNYNDARITKLRTYLFSIIDTLTTDKKYQINANMLDNDINNYSLDKIPTASTVEKWVTGVEIHKDIYSFRSRKAYSQDVINNLSNIGFFEIFESIIKSNNKKGVLPNIEGIQSIECLNCGTMLSADTNTAEFEIQIQITYREE